MAREKGSNLEMRSGIDREVKADFFFPENLNKGTLMAASSDADTVFERVKTQLFNGYAQEVAHLYKGLNGEKLYV